MEKLLNSVKDHSTYEIVLDSVKFLMKKILKSTDFLQEKGIKLHLFYIKFSTVVWKSKI